MSGNQLMENLRDLAKMKQDGSLTEEEFKQFKEKLMNDDEPSAKKVKVSSDTVENFDTASEKSTHPAGSWTCTVCQNVNWPMRTHCNRKSCGLPRWQVDPTASAITQSQQIPAQMMSSMGSNNGTMGQYQMLSGYCAPPNGTMSSQMASSMGSQQMGYGFDSYNSNTVSAEPYLNQRVLPAASSSEAPPGSWTCVACGNVNWPMRKVCNRKNCEQPRPDMSNGMGVTNNSHSKGKDVPNPPGSWECILCGNINWPMRTVCNRKECNAERPPEIGKDVAGVATPAITTTTISNGVANGE